MKIGVAIPSYYGHISRLFDLLDSIENQTILPDKVVVSCSSTNSFENTKKYNFSLDIIITSDKHNASQNRNIAALNLLNMNYITFIDADDIMHPQRIEMLLYAFKTYNSDIILHNYINEIPIFAPNIFQNILNINIRTNTLIQSASGCITHIDGYNDTIDKIHHSQVTIKTEIFTQVKFPEEDIYNRKEDCVFCYRVFSLPNIKHAYIQNELSYYKPSNCFFIKAPQKP